MSGSNISVLDIPPGITSDGTVYSTGKRWRDCNLIRWKNDILTPIGGWTRPFVSPHTNTIKDMFSWRDYLKQPWMASGSMTELFCTVMVGGEYTSYDATPLDLDSSILPSTGYGSGLYGAGPYGVGFSMAPDTVGQWSFDNFGRLLVAVHSQDGRLLSWDPLTPSTLAAPVTGAPVDNTLCVVTEEEFCMVFGGVNNPRRIKWSSRSDLNDWAPTEINTAGGFELKSNGAIKAVKKVQGGILVLTDIDVHIIEYVGPPNYYSRRRISEDCGVVSKNSVASIPGGAVWASEGNFWIYDGNIDKMECPVHTKVFLKSNFNDPSNVFMGVNEHAQEVWLFYPNAGSIVPDRYVFFSYARQPYWSVGNSLTRTAWLNPVWQDRPFMANGTVIYEHETGWLADGETRVGDIFAVTGGVELGQGDTNMRVDRAWADSVEEEFEQPGSPDPHVVPNNYTVTFGLRQAPNAVERYVGPIQLNSHKGYTSLRFRARQLTLRVDQIVDDYWTLGKIRLRVKKAGVR